MDPQRGNNSTRSRLWLFRILTMALGILPVILVEMLFAAMGWGAPEFAEDPFVGFSATMPLFQLNETQETYVLSESRRKFFAPEQFPARKRDDAVRIFCLGGSTVQGRPYSIETSFTSWLELALRECDPSRTWDVVNCGGISYASYRLVPILQECLNYQPDLFLICTGHNEFLEDRSYRQVRQIPTWIRPPLLWVSQSRIAVATRRALTNAGVLPDSRSKREQLDVDADAMLDYRNGLAAFHRDDARAAGIHQHFEANLIRMIRMATSAGVPVILMRPASNLGDQPPFKSEPGENLSPAQIEASTKLVEQAHAALSTDLDHAVSCLQQASEIDSRNASIWYELGLCREAQQQFAAARSAFIRARDEDVCPLRMTTPLEDALFRVARTEQVPLLDAHTLLEEQTTNGILSGYWLVDHVHPSIQGHQLLALELVSLLAADGIVDPPHNWKERARKAFASHFSSLDRSYFHRGRRMLHALREWTKGRADGPPAEIHLRHRMEKQVPRR